MSQGQRSDAVTVAVGGSLVLAASLGDRALRLVVTWLLSTALGPEIFGSYTFAVTVATIVAAFGPIGVDRGAVYFGARYRQSNSWSKLRGLLQSTLVISMCSAVVVCSNEKVVVINNSDTKTKVVRKWNTRSRMD